MSRLPPARIAVILVFAALAAVTFADLGRPLGNGDEVVYAQNVREMRRGGDYLTLRWQGVEVLQRPALPFVLAAAGSALIDGEAGLRGASAAASLLTLLVLYLGAVRLWASRSAALAAALLCAGAPSFHVFSRALLSDPTFVLATTAALCAAAWALRQPERSAPLVAAGAALGAAFACKSLAAAVPALALAPAMIVAARRAGPRVAAASAAALVALAAPFYLVGLLRHGNRFVDEHIAYSLMARARGDLEVGMAGGPLAYVRYLAEIDGPVVLGWMALAVAGAGVLAWRRRDGAAGAAAGFVLVVLAALSMVGTRLPHYLLPIYPAAALCAAAVIAAALAGLERRSLPRRRVLAAVAPAAAATVALLGLADPAPEAHLLPSPEARRLGLAAAGVAGPNEPVHTLEWYAPAVAYYADRPLVMLTESEATFQILDDVDFLRAAGAAAKVPPPPRAGPMLVAGPEAALAGAAWLHVDEVVAADGDLVLVRATAHSAAPAVPAAPAVAPEPAFR